MRTLHWKWHFSAINLLYAQTVRVLWPDGDVLRQRTRADPCSGKCQGRESKAEIMVLNGIVTEIRYSEVAGRAPLEFREMKYFQELVSARANDIVQKWIDFFVLHKSIKPECITRRLP